MGKYIELTADNFKDTISSGVTLVDFGLLGVGLAE